MTNRRQPGAIHMGRMLGVAGMILCLSSATGLAGKVVLKNGMEIPGKPIPIQGLNATVISQQPGEIPSFRIILVESAGKRYFVPLRQIAHLDKDADLSRYEMFEIPQRKTRGHHMTVQEVGTLSDATTFDGYGRRRVTLATQNGPQHIIQGITKVTPQSITVTGLSHNWEYGIATTSIPPERLAPILNRAIDPMNPDDRRAIVRFYLQAGMYPQAHHELESIARDFPELAESLKELSAELFQLQTKRLLEELRYRRNSGQHLLAQQAIEQLPVEQLSAVVLKEIRELKHEYEKSREQIDRVRGLLGELQAQLDDANQVSAVMPLRSIVSEEVDVDSLKRLDAFLKLETDNTLAPEEKLGLAYSGWVLGSGSAVADLDAALQFWKARFYILEYLRSADPHLREEMLSKLLEVEGVSTRTVAQIIPLLPPILDASHIQPGQAAEIVAEVENAEVPVRYSVLMPIEYNPNRKYPLIVALRPSGRSAAEELLWWGGDARNPLQAQRHGYIVIAPEYIQSDQKEYDYSARAHYIVLQALRDARKRFQVDSDRVFLAGHGQGGDAAFDIGMSHPDLFAGVIPISGVSDQFCMHYWENSENVSWYVINGERDPRSMSRNDRELNRMLRYNFDIIYTEYTGRGPESFYAEIHRLFEWMSSCKRLKYPDKFEAKTLRVSDDRFYWLKLDGMPPNVTQTVLKPSGSRRTRPAHPMLVKMQVTPGNSVYVTSGADRHTVYLSPEMLDLDQRVTVKVNGRTRFNGFAEYLGKEAIRTMLEDLRIRGDRQKLFWVKLEL